MDKTTLYRKKSKNYAVKNESSPFDKIIPEEPQVTSIQIKRYTYVNSSNVTKVINLEKSNKYHQSILIASHFGYQSDWCKRLSERSRPTYFDEVKIFFNWINESNHDTTSETRYDILKTYEKYELNQRGRTNSPLPLIITVLREGMGSPSLTRSEYNYIQSLLSFSRPIKKAEPVSYTLSSWFDLPWLRSAIGDQNYLQLESPRILINSFRVTIATTLLFLLNQRKREQLYSTIEFDTKKANWPYDWNRLIIERDGLFDELGEPVGELSQLLVLDLVRPAAKQKLKKRIREFGLQNLPRHIAKKEIATWQHPVLFHPDYQIRYSPLEELLCGWLAACEGIQPSDIPKLQINNYAFERNRYGGLIAMECTYYKGRSGTTHQPQILLARDVWAQALHQYMEGLSGKKLFSTPISNQNTFSITYRQNTRLRLLLRIWKLPAFQKQL